MHPDGIKGFYCNTTVQTTKVTISEWVKFNKPLLNFDDVIVKVFRCRNLHKDNCCMTTKMKIADMELVFGQYSILHIGIDSCISEFGGERTTLKFVIYKEV